MKVIVDTHVFLWMLVDRERIKSNLQSILSESEIFLSSISYFEIQHKRKLKKLDVEIDFDHLITENIITELPLTFEHSEYCLNLPLIHRDPFDRMLIAQSIIEKIPLITADKMIQQYDFKFISA